MFNVNGCQKIQSAKVNSNGNQHLYTRGFIRSQQKRQKQLELVPDDALIVGLDLAQKAHFVWMSNVHKQPLHHLKIPHSPAGLEFLYKRAQEIRDMQGLGTIVFAMEATGHYWMNVATYFQHHAYRYVMVHSLSVKRERESTYYRYSKSDYRDSELIANLTADRKITFTQLPQNQLWASLKSAATEYLRLTLKLASEQMRLHSFLQRLYPTYQSVFSLVNGTTALGCLLSMRDISQVAALTYLEQVRLKSKRRIYKYKVLDFHDLANHSQPDWGAPVYGPGLQISIAHSAERYQLLETQKQESERQLLALYHKTAYTPYLNSIPNLPPVRHAAILGLTGDPALYDISRCLTRFAGMDIKENQSGKFEGKTPVSHRGHPLLRYAAYVAGFVLKSHDPIFAQRYRDLTARTTRPLKKNQAIVAIGCKYLRIFWTLCTQRTHYDPNKAKYGTKVKNQQVSITV